MTILTKLQIDMIRSKISGLGFFVPENVVSNDDLSKLFRAFIIQFFNNSHDYKKSLDILKPMEL